MRIARDYSMLVKADDGLKEGEFIAYPSTFTRTPDAYGDVVAPHAFDKTLESWRKSGDTIPVMYDHRMDDPRYNIGAVEDTGTDAHGWWIKAKLDLDNPIAAQVYKLVKARRLNQLSFAFDILKSHPVEVSDGVKARQLDEVQIYEASLCPVGANQDTSVVAVKAGQTLSAANKAFLLNISSQLSNVLTQLSTFLGKAGAPNIKNSDGKPSNPVDKTEEPTKSAKVEDPKALRLATEIAVRLDGRKD